MVLLSMRSVHLDLVLQSLAEGAHSPVCQKVMLFSSVSRKSVRTGMAFLSMFSGHLANMISELDPGPVVIIVPVAVKTLGRLLTFLATGQTGLMKRKDLMQVADAASTLGINVQNWSVFEKHVECEVVEDSGTRTRQRSRESKVAVKKESENRKCERCDTSYKSEEAANNCLCYTLKKCKISCRKIQQGTKFVHRNKINNNNEKSPERSYTLDRQKLKKMKRCKVYIRKFTIREEMSSVSPQKISGNENTFNMFDNTWKDDLEELDIEKGPAIYQDVNDAIYKDDFDEDVPHIKAKDITDDVNIGVNISIPAGLEEFTMEQGRQEDSEDTKEESSSSEQSVLGDWTGLDSFSKETRNDNYVGDQGVNCDEDPLALQQEFVQVFLSSSE